jgi:thiol-disulfide isomerase/thioredoxin
MEIKNIRIGSGFQDGQGQTRTIADFKGKVVVLNIWATWCVPCRREMAALD